MTIDLIRYNSQSDLAHLGLSPNDIYQTHAYHALESARNGNEPYLFTCQSEDIKIAAPVLISPIPNAETFYDATSVYGYPGILWNGTLSAGKLKDFLRGINHIASKKNIVSIFLRLHPFYNQFYIDESNGIAQVLHGKTIYVDLSPDYDEISNSYSANHKRGLRKLKNAGYTVSINEWNHYDSFISAYHETMTFVEAKGDYFFTREYFVSLQELLSPHLHLISVLNADGEFVSGALFFHYNSIIQYHLGATKQDFRQDAPSKLVFDAAIQYFRNHGDTILHLGGGVGSIEDDLFRFKTGFSKKTLQYATIRCISNPEVYEKLVVEAHGINFTDTGYFPLYKNS